MAKNILVATPQPAFGELLRLSLEESGRYRVRLVQAGREALASAEHILFSMAILDAALVEPPLRFVALGLRKSHADIRLLVILPEEGETSPEVTAIRADGFVSQPFYAPSLLETIDSLLSEQQAAPAGAAQPAENPPNIVLQDPALATHQLEEFLKDSSAPAVLLLRMQQPWAAAGQLNREALNEVAGLLSRYTKANEGVDLARYVHLKSDGGEYLIYATPVTEVQVLSLIYQVTTPLTVIRAQAGRLARLLRQANGQIPAPLVVAAPANLTQAAPRAQTKAASAAFLLEPKPLPTAASVPTPVAPQTTIPPQPPAGSLPPPGMTPSQAQPASIPVESTPVQPTQPEAGIVPAPTPAGLSPAEFIASNGLPFPGEVEEADTLMEAEAMRLADLLSEMPGPNPESRPKPEPGDWVQAVPQEPGFLFPWEMESAAAPTQAIPAASPTPISSQPPIITPPVDEELPAAQPIAETTPAPPPPETIPAAHITQKIDLGTNLMPTRAIPVHPAIPPSGQAQPPIEQPASDSASLTLANQVTAELPPKTSPSAPINLPAIEQTRPVLARSLTPTAPAEVGGLGITQPAYTSVLLPRLPGHILEGFLADRLADWLPQLCLAYGWRLQGLMIHPDYLQWTVQIPPAVSPGNGVRLIRQQTSRRIFSQFPQLEIDNPSGDFWAPGYLIISGYQPPSLHLVQDFIRQTRLRQGAWYP